MVSGYLSQQDVYRRNSKEVVSTLSHDFNVTSNDDTTHTAKCERCGFEVVDEEHTYSDGVCTVCAKAQ
jgi:formylmethanofuran dehydrogenase subunit E